MERPRERRPITHSFSAKKKKKVESYRVSYVEHGPAWANGFASPVSRKSRTMSPSGIDEWQIARHIESPQDFFCTRASRKSASGRKTAAKDGFFGCSSSGWHGVIRKERVRRQPVMIAAVRKVPRGLVAPSSTD